MKPIDAEFVSPRQPPRIAWLVPAALFAAAVFFVVLTIVEQRDASRAIEHLRQSHLAEVEQARALNSNDNSVPYRDSALKFLAAREGPWAALVALETMACPQVRPASFNYSADPRQISVELEFVDYPSLTSCIEALNAGLPEGAPGLRWEATEVRWTEGRPTAHMVAR